MSQIKQLLMDQIENTPDQESVPKQIIPQQGRNWEAFKMQHPEYKLFGQLQDRLPKYVRLLNKLAKKDFKLPLNDKGLPF